MTAANFPTCLAFTLREEGGWSDDPQDPGGATNHGITLRTLQSFHHGATVGDLRNISDVTVSMIFRRNYWATMGCDGLPPGIDLSVFDFGVTAGPQRSVRYLQLIAGVTEDGINGQHTQAAVAKMALTDVLTALNGLQIAHYKALPTFGHFGHGWLARTERRVKAALTMVPTTRPQAVAAVQGINHG